MTNDYGTISQRGAAAAWESQPTDNAHDPMATTERNVITGETVQRLVDGLEYCLEAIRALKPTLRLEDRDYLNQLADLVDEAKSKLGV